jgi:hypothetical protein
LPPVDQSRQLYSLDPATDPELQKQAVEMRFDRPAVHPYSLRNFRIVTTL